MAGLPTIERQPRAFNADSRKAILDAVGHPPADIARILDTVTAKIAAIDQDDRYTADAKQRMRDETIAAAQQQFDAAHATYRKDQLRDLGQAEGTARAALRNDPPSLDPYAPDGERVKAHIRLAHEANTQRRIDLDLRELDAATVLADVLDVFEEAEALGGEVMRRVGKHAVRRATALFGAMRKANPGQASPDALSSPDARTVSSMRERYAQFQKGNLTPAQQLKRPRRQSHPRAAVAIAGGSLASGVRAEVNEAGRPFTRLARRPRPAVCGWLRDAPG